MITKLNKKITLISVVTLSLVALTSCSSGNDDSKKDNGSKPKDQFTSTVVKAPTPEEAAVELKKYAASLSGDDKKYYPSLLADSQSVIDLFSKISKEKGTDWTNTSDKDITHALLDVEAKLNETRAFVRRDVLTGKAFGINVTTIPPITTVVLCVNLPDKGEDKFYIYPGDCVDRFAS